MQSYERKLDDYMHELDRVYRRAMETPLDGLLSDEAMMIKRFQMSAKTSKDKLKELHPEMLRHYEAANEDARLRMEQDLERLHSELRCAWAELELALQKR